VSLDQYYTRPDVAEACLHRLKVVLADRDFNVAQTDFVEPSAGTGAFLHLLPPGTVAIDLDPQAPDIIARDLLGFRPIYLHRSVVVVGNPPFGKNASLAVKFFNQAALIGHIIAFIVPRTFRKASVQDRLDSRFHLVDEFEIPPFAFIHEGKPYDVQCVFQIWVRHRRDHRPIAITTLHHPDLVFVRKNQLEVDDPFALAIQRVGSGAGTIKEQWWDCAESSHYFLSVSDPVFARLLMIDFDQVKHDVAGNPSISKGELIALYEATPEHPE